MTDRFIRLENKSNPEALSVVGLTGLKRTAIYDRIRAGKFPAPIHISSRAVVWSMAEVSAWVEAQKAARITGEASA